MFKESSEDLFDWLVDTDMPIIMAEAILEYLLSHGKSSMMNIMQGEDEIFLDYAAEHVGMVPLFSIIQQEALLESGSSITILTWSSQFVIRLLQITHRQWSFRNAAVYLKKLEGRTESEHEKIFNEVQQIMMLIDPSSLLPCHQTLLEEDFLELGRGPTRDRIHWLNRIESAVAARRAVQGMTNGERLDGGAVRTVVGCATGSGIIEAQMTRAHNAGRRSCTVPNSER